MPLSFALLFLSLFASLSARLITFPSVRPARAAFLSFGALFRETVGYFRPAFDFSRGVFVWLLVLLAENLSAGHSLRAQNLPIMPEQASNRRLGFFSDAAALGWNPAVLGMRGALDAVALLPFGGGEATMFDSFGGFIKVAPFGFGFTRRPSDNATQYYTGFGLNIMDDFLWLGASGRFYNLGALDKLSLESLRYNAAAVLKPREGFYFGLSLSSMAQDQSRAGAVVRLNASYSPAQWYCLFAEYASEGAATRGFGLGGSVSVLDDKAILSAHYNPTQNVFTVGLEANLGPLGAGVLGGVPGGGAGGMLLARLSNDAVRSAQAVFDSRADDNGCRKTADTMYAHPDYFAERLGEFNPSLKALADSLSPDPRALRKTIAQTYYAPLGKRATTMTGDTVPIVSRAGHDIEYLTIDHGDYPFITAALRVKDAAGRMVAGLGKNDFLARDSAVAIVSVVESDTAKPVPVDIVFVIDCSGSMQSNINETRNNARAFVESLRKRGADCRIGCILYGLDVVDALEPTSDFARFEAFIAKAGANQPDEYAPGALELLVGMKFRERAQRIAILITDEQTYVGSRAAQTEVELVQALWRRGITLHGIVNFCDNNGSFTVRLTLGEEFDIKEPFALTLRDIGKELTTTYSVTYKKSDAPVAIAQGAVRGERGEPLGAAIRFKDSLGYGIGPAFSDTATGAFRREIVAGKRYTVTIEPLGHPRYVPLRVSLDASSARRGDTVRLPQPLAFRQAAFLRGTVKDEAGNPVAAEVRLFETGGGEPIEASERLASEDSAGTFFFRISEGVRYTARVTPLFRNLEKYLPLTTTLDLTSLRKGDTATRHFVLRSNTREVTLNGRVTVTQPVRRAVAGAVVTAKEIVTQKRLAQAVCGADGRYSMRLPKHADVELSIAPAAGDYYADTARVFVSKRDSASVITRNFQLVWKNILVIGRAESSPNARILVQTHVSANEGNEARVIAQTTTDARGVYKLIVPKERPVQIVGQSSEYFFDAFTLNIPKPDTATIARNLRIPEALSMRFHFPSDQHNTPTPYMLDSNGAATPIMWRQELDRVAQNLLLYKTSIAKVLVIGHTDATSTAEYNKKLGLLRAEFIRDALVERGVPTDMLEVSSKGALEPLTRRANETMEQYRARCRRVELIKLRK